MKVSAAIMVALTLAPLTTRSETLGVISKELANSDVMSVEITDTRSTHPYCGGKLEAVAHVYDRNIGSSFPHSRGCWTAANGKVSADLWTYSGGDEVSIFADIGDIGLTEFGKKALQQHIAKPADKGTKIPPIDGELKSALGNSMIFGACGVVGEAQALAKSPDEINFLEKLKAAVATSGDFDVNELDTVCKEAIAEVIKFTNRASK